MVKTKKEAKYESVLLIDDENIDNFINERIITTSLFAKHVVVRSSAIEGLDYLKKNNGNLPKIIFLDLNMKIHDGFWFLEEYQKLKAANTDFKDKCKIIVLSSSISEEEINRASTNPNVFKFLNKPLTENYLEAINL